MSVFLTSHRTILASIRLGWRGRCPSCGEGSILVGYLDRAAQCPCCGEELHHARFGGALPLVVIPLALIPGLIVGYLATRFGTGHVVSDILLAEMVGLYIAFEALPRVAGSLTALEWALQMGGFDPAFSPETDPAAQALGVAPGTTLQSAE
jgi:uncharacterized protein (DUF983 family)